jgi:hypothetical protein
MRQKEQQLISLAAALVKYLSAQHFLPRGRPALLTAGGSVRKIIIFSSGWPRAERQKLE